MSACVPLLFVYAACAASETAAPPPTITPEPTATAAPAPTATPVLIVTQATCTGSMEPAITCLDQRVERWAPLPDDVAVGSVVSFASTTCWPDDPAAATTSHRVIEVRGSGERTEYLTQGDANPDPDCWLSHDAIKTVTVDVRRNVYRENTELRDAVNAARTAYDTAKADYLVFIEVECGVTDPTACALSGDAYDEGRRLYEHKEATKVQFECWFASAKRMERPGHIPERC